MNDRVKAARLDLLAQAGSAMSLFRAGRRKDAFLAARDRAVTGRLFGADAAASLGTTAHDGGDDDVGEFVLGDKTERHEHRGGSSWPLGLGLVAVGTGLGVAGLDLGSAEPRRPEPPADERRTTAVARPIDPTRYRISAGPPAGWSEP